MLLISYSENLFPINKIYYATLQEKRGIKKMILATTQDALLSKVLFTIGAFIGLLFLSFLYIGKIKDDKKTFRFLKQYLTLHKSDLFFLSCFF